MEQVNEEEFNKIIASGKPSNAHRSKRVKSSTSVSLLSIQMYLSLSEVGTAEVYILNKRHCFK